MIELSKQIMNQVEVLSLALSSELEDMEEDGQTKKVKEIEEAFSKFLTAVGYL